MSASQARGASPYALEAHRVALLRRRSRLLLAGILLGTLLMLAVLASTIRQSDDINTFNGRGSTVDVNLPTSQTRAKPTTLSVSPGRTTVLDQPIQPEVRPARDSTAVPVTPDYGLNWLGLVTNIGPPIAAALYAWRLGQKRALGPLEQVNFGVYKGALPLELHSAAHRRHIFTRQQAHAPLFGRKAQDFLPATPMVLVRPPAARPQARRS